MDFAHLAGHDRTVDTGVLCDLAQRCFQSLADDLDAGVLIGVFAFQTVKHFTGLNQSNTAANNNTFLHSSTGRVQRVIDTVLTLFDFDLGHAANADNGNTACQLGHAFLQFFLVVVASGFLDLLTDLADPCFDLGLFAMTIDDGCRRLW